MEKDEKNLHNQEMNVLEGKAKKLKEGLNLKNSTVNTTGS